MGCLTDDAAGVENCADPDGARENWRAVEVEVGPSTMDGALSERDRDARVY